MLDMAINNLCDISKKWLHMNGKREIEKLYFTLV